MYARTAGKQDLTFTVSGKLWKRSLVMQDEESDTLWSHLLGRAMEGKWKGTELEVIPSELTNWESWKTKHPDSDVLDMSRTTDHFVTEVQKKPGAFTLGIRLDEKVMDFPFDVLRKQPVLSVSTGNTPFLVTFDTPSATPRVFSRKLSGKTLIFSNEHKQLVDSKTKSVWNPTNGVCVKGSLKGKQLQMLPCIPSYVKAWKSFYPKSDTYSPD